MKNIILFSVIGIIILAVIINEILKIFQTEGGIIIPTVIVILFLISLMPMSHIISDIRIARLPKTEVKATIVEKNVGNANNIFSPKTLKFKTDNGNKIIFKGVTYKLYHACKADEGDFGTLTYRESKRVKRHYVSFVCDNMIKQ
jgi:hypothetical protein